MTRSRSFWQGLWTVLLVEMVALTGCAPLLTPTPWLPSPSFTVTHLPSQTASFTRLPSATASVTASFTVSPSPTQQTGTPTPPTATLTLTHTVTQTPTITPTPLPVLHELPGGRRWITGLAFDPLGRWLAASNMDGTLRIWSLEDWTLLRTLQISAGMNNLAFRHDGQLLAAAADDSTLRLWDLQTGDELPWIGGLPQQALSVAFHPDGTQLAAGCADGSLGVWRLSGEPVLLIKDLELGHIWGVAFSPGGNLLAAAGQRAIVYDMRQKKLVWQSDWRASAVAFSPDSLRLYVAGEHLEAWDLKTATRVLAYEGHTDWIWALTVHMPSERMASAGQDGTVRLWQMRQPFAWAVLADSRAPVNAVALSPDGRWLAAGGDDQQVRIYQLIP